MRILVSIIFFGLAALSSQASFDEAGARLQLLSNVMNSRDYEVGLAEIKDLKVLHAACEIEKANQRFPISCLELKRTDNIDCFTYFSQAPESEVETLWAKREFMDKACRQALRNRRALLLYKKTGQKIE